MARVMSKVFSSSGSGDVLSSIRKLVADEAQQDTPPASSPVFRSSVRTPDPAAVPFRHTSGARDWLVGVIDEEKRSVASSDRAGPTQPLALKTPIGRTGSSLAGAQREWEPRISLALVNPLKAPVSVSEPRAANDPVAAAEFPEKSPAADEAPTQRFQPWKQDAMSDGFSRIKDARGDGASMSRLLLTPDFRVPGPGEPANFNTPAPRSKPRFTMKPADSQNSDIVGSAIAQPAAKKAAPASLAPSQIASSTSDKAVAGDARALDEDMLRDVVADVVREELRGALGERITRNVRKLVRSEINRAVEATKLTEQDDD